VFRAYRDKHLHIVVARDYGKVRYAYGSFVAMREKAQRCSIKMGQHKIERTKKNPSFTLKFGAMPLLSHRKRTRDLWSKVMSRVFKMAACKGRSALCKRARTDDNVAGTTGCVTDVACKQVTSACPSGVETTPADGSMHKLGHDDAGSKRACLQRLPRHVDTAAVNKSLRDFRCRLACSLAFKSPSGHERPLFPCVQPGCGCMGVFFKNSGGTQCTLVLRVWVEPETRGVEGVAVAEWFSAMQPVVAVAYGSALGVMYAHAERCKDALYAFAPDGQRFGGGVWIASFRPTLTCKQGQLAYVQVSCGDANVVQTTGFEVHTKATNTLLMEFVPRKYASLEGVTTLLTYVQAPLPFAVTARDPLLGHDDGACGSSDAGATVFIWFTSKVDTIRAYVLLDRWNVVNNLQRGAASGEGGSRTQTRVLPLPMKPEAKMRDVAAALCSILPSPIVSVTRAFRMNPSMPDVPTPRTANLMHFIQACEESTCLQRAHAPAQLGVCERIVSKASDAATSVTVPLRRVSSRERDIVLPVFIDLDSYLGTGVASTCDRTLCSAALPQMDAESCDAFADRKCSSLFGVEDDDNYDFLLVP
jgi:hypothetical protein